MRIEPKAGYIYQFCLPQGEEEGGKDEAEGLLCSSAGGTVPVSQGNLTSTGRACCKQLSGLQQRPACFPCLIWEPCIQAHLVCLHA